MMGFQIAIKDFKKVYVPGDKIEGSVVLNVRSDIAAGAVRIHFKGKSKAKFKTGNREYTNKAVLFHFTETLYSGNYTLSAAKHFEWPFEFSFPGTPQNPREDIEFKKKDSWIYDSSWALPPSLAVENQAATNELTCDVEYKLVAELMKPASSFSFNARRFHAQKLLNFSPERAEPNPAIESVYKKTVWRVQSLRILPDFQSRSLTMKEKMHSVFSSNLPLSVFYVNASLPNQIVQGSVLPIHLKVEHRTASSTTDIVPAVHLRELSVSIRILTTARADTAFGHWEIFDSDKKYTILERRGLDFPLFDENTSLEPEVTPLDFGEMLNVRCDLPINFLSYNIRRDYALKLKVVVQCADKRHELRQMVYGFRILSRSYSGRSVFPDVNNTKGSPGKINDVPAPPSYPWPSGPSWNPEPPQQASPPPESQQVVSTKFDLNEPPPAYQP